MTQSPIFLDTSIQIQRLLSKRPEQKDLETAFSELAPRLCTSNYVWMEFQRTVVNDYAHIHKLMLTHGNWGDVIEDLLKGPRSFRSRSAVRCTQILGQLFKDSRENLEYGLYLAEQSLTRSLKIRFWTHVTQVSDSILCDLVTAGITRQSDRSFAVPSSCRKESAACHLPDFLTQHHSELTIIVDYLKANSKVLKNQTRVENLLAKVLDEPQSALGQSTCWPLGDIIILLQVPSDGMLWTLDKDFEALAKELGIHLYRG